MISDALIDVQDSTGKRSCRSVRSHASTALRRAPRDSSTLPFPISPRVRTLRKKSSSSVASTHFVTFGSGYGRMSSERRLVASRNPLTNLRASVIRRPFEIDPGFRQRGFSKEPGEAVWLLCSFGQPLELFQRQDDRVPSGTAK